MDSASLAPLQRVYIEITNVCNLRCRFCAGTSRPPEFMTPAFFSHVLHAVRPLASQVSLHVLGEPCLHPDLDKIIECCAQADMAVDLTTNGTLLGEKRDTVLAPAVRQVNISVHGVEEESGINWERLNSMLDFVRFALHARPDVYINLRLWNRQPVGSVQPGENTAALLNFIAKALSVPCLPVPPGRKSRRITGRLYLHQDTQFSWPGHQPLPPQRHGFCHALSTQCAVLVDGTVCPCCLDAEGHIPLGSLHQHTLVEILQSPRATAMRAGFAQGLLVEPLCQSCSYCRRFPPRATRK